MSIVFCEFSSVHDARIFSCPREAVCQLSHSVLTGFSPLCAEMFAGFLMCLKILLMSE